ncbi:MAG: type II toxin-antitoxin system RelE/ParE family toxin [Aquabacterium sp.]
MNASPKLHKQAPSSQAKNEGFSSPAAQDDLLDIALYIAVDIPRRAATFVDELERQCNLLGEVPGIGTARPELDQGIPHAAHGRYLIFYHEQEDQLRIERILHGARDIDVEDF